MTQNIKPRRSILYVPGGTARMHEKARGVAADGVVIDLEDSVAPEAKAAARELTAGTVRAGGFGPRELAIRINPPGSPWFAEDLEAAGRAMPDAILMTKVDRPQTVLDAEARLDGLGVPPDVALWAMIETPRGVLNCSAIADLAEGRSKRLKGLLLGTNDIAKDTGFRAGAGRGPMVPALAMAVIAARAAGLFILDGVYNDFSDHAGFEAECLQGRELGFDGKTLIHPGQIEAANRVFSPPPEEVDEARRIIAAFDLPENRGLGAIRFEGRMVELLHAEVARRTIEMAERISERESA